MKAIQIVKPGEIRTVELPMPQIEAPDQVLVKVKYVGICGSDLHILHGTNAFATYPRVFGHEMAGQVEQVGPAVKDLVPGDHVILEPITYCGTCYACTHGQPNVCEKLQVSGVHVDGAAAQYLVARAGALHKIDGSIPWEIAVLTEPLTIGSQSCERGQVGAGDVVLIGGAGTIGLCVLVNAKLRGATCIITDIVQDKLDYARSLGADHVINVGKEDMSRAVRAIVGESGVNVFIDAVGYVPSVEAALELLSPAGRIVCLGFGTEKVSLPFLSITRRQAQVVGSRLQAGQFPPVIRALEAGRYPVADFVSRAFTLDQAQEAFDYAQQRAGSYRKLIIRMDEAL